MARAGAASSLKNGASSPLIVGQAARMRWDGSTFASPASASARSSIDLNSPEILIGPSTSRGALDSRRSLSDLISSTSTTALLLLAIAMMSGRSNSIRASARSRWPVSPMGPRRAMSWVLTRTSRALSEYLSYLDMPTPRA